MKEDKEDSNSFISYVINNQHEDEASEEMRDEQMMQEILQQNERNSRLNCHQGPQDRKYESRTIDVDKIVPSISINGGNSFNKTSYNIRHHDASRTRNNRWIEETAAIEHFDRV